MTRSSLWTLKPYNINCKIWPRSLIHGLLPQKGVPFQIFPLFFFPLFPSASSTLRNQFNSYRWGLFQCLLFRVQTVTGKADGLFPMVLNDFEF